MGGVIPVVLWLGGLALSTWSIARIVGVLRRRRSRARLLSQALSEGGLSVSWRRAGIHYGVYRSRVVRVGYVEKCDRSRRLAVVTTITNPVDAAFLMTGVNGTGSQVERLVSRPDFGSHWLGGANARMNVRVGDVLLDRHFSMANRPPSLLKRVLKDNDPLREMLFQASPRMSIRLREDMLIVYPEVADHYALQPDDWRLYFEIGAHFAESFERLV